MSTTRVPMLAGPQGTLQLEHPALRATLVESDGIGPPRLGLG